MRTTVIMNLKGGVGKTTTAINMAAILARLWGKKVLVIDADSQCNTTEFFGGDPRRGNMAQILRQEHDGVMLAMNSAQPTELDGIDVICGDESLMDLDLTKVELGSVQTGVLRDMVKRLDELGLYDFCIIDCPPAFNAAAAAALIAADDVVIPMKLDAFSLRGMACLLRQIANMKKINPKLRLAGVLPTMYYKDALIQEAEMTLRESALPAFTPIRRSDKVDGMTFAQDPLENYSPRSAAGYDYRVFVSEYVVGGTNNG